MSNLGHYWKAILAALGAAAVAVQTAITDDVITDAEKVTIAIAIITAITVYGKANDPKGA